MKTLPSKLYSSLIAVFSTTIISTTLFVTGCSQTTVDTTSKSASTTTNETALTSSSADTNNTVTFNEAEIIKTLSANLAISGIESDIIAVEATQVEGLYWVRAEGMPGFFTDKSGKYVIQGDVVEVGGNKPVDITAELNAKVSKEKLSSVNKEDMIIYPAKGETKSIIYVFTDVTCPYCRKLHEELAELNTKGVEVRHLAWPRNKKSEPIMQSVWCSEDKTDALDKIQSGIEIEPNNCASTAVKSQTELGLTLGVRGTPAIYTESGEQIGGYLPADAIIKALGL